MSRFELLNENDEIMYEDADKFEPYPNEKLRLKLHSGEKYEELKASIIANGIIQPVIVMPSETRGMLVCIAGANRIKIASELNLKVPYQLKTNITQEQADSICIDTNLLNRQIDEYQFSELAWILKTKWEINNKQGERNDLKETSCTMFTKSKIEEEYKMSKRNIQYYIRLTYLTDELLQMVDNKKISFRSAVELSYLKLQEMSDLYEYINDHKINLSIKIAEELKKISQESDDIINVKGIIDEMNGNNNNTEKIKFNKITKDKIKKIMPNDDIGKFNEIIIDALEYYYQNKV